MAGHAASGGIAPGKDIRDRLILALYAQLKAERDTREALEYVIRKGAISPEVLEAIAADPLRGNARMGRYTYFANPLRLPVISVPAGLREDGLPFGLSLVAPQNADGRLYALARELHARTSTRLGATKHSLPAFAPHDARNATPA